MNRERIREALKVLIDPELPWVHDDNNLNCGECWECIAGTLGVARAIHRSGLNARGALDIKDPLPKLQSMLAERTAVLEDGLFVVNRFLAAHTPTAVERRERFLANAKAALR